MKKLLKRVLIVVGVIALLYFVYLFFIMPNGFVNEEAVVTSFIENIESSDVCQTHFIEETSSICEAFITSVEEESLVIESMTKTSSGMSVVIKVTDEVDLDFDFTFKTYEPSGLRKFFNGEYYLIETMH